MIQIRKNVFETNSSSTHSVAVPKQVKDYSGRHVHFYFGEYGWEFDEEDSASYLYTLIYEMENPDELLEKLKTILTRNNITFEFEGQNKEGRYAGFFDPGYVDHGNEFKDFIKALFDAGDDYVLSFIFDGLVFTGNDNAEKSVQCFTERENNTYREFNWDTHTYEEHENPYYMPNHADYDWYYK